MQGQPFVFKGKTLLSGIDPINRCDRIAEAVSVKDSTLYFCPSPLYGYGLPLLLSRLEKEAPSSAILCIEADSELYELSVKNIGFYQTQNQTQKTGGKLQLTNICDAGELCAFINHAWGERFFKRIEVVRFSGGWQLFTGLYETLSDAIRREIATQWSNVITLAKLGRLYIKNVFRNLELQLEFPSISSIFWGAANTLVLGAGPSLDDTLDYFEKYLPQKYKNKESRNFKIICVDTCLGSLKERGITPDLAVILESQYWNLSDFYRCKNWDIPFAVDLSAYPQSVRVLGKSGYLFMTPWKHLNIFERLNNIDLIPDEIPPLGSVGLTSVEIARRITRGNIICTGLDFSFTWEKFHARGAPGHHDILNKHNRFSSIIKTPAFNNSPINAVSKNGLPVKSNPVMRNYRDLFENEYSIDKRIFDISGSGLSLGLKTFSLERAFSMLMESEGKCNMESNINCENIIEINNKKEKLILFISDEIRRLNEIRNILTGNTGMKSDRLKEIIMECDYLWAHFPDAPFIDTHSINISDLPVSFFNRLRMEIDPILILLNRVCQNIHL